jgi:hypothetical protein
MSAAAGSLVPPTLSYGAYIYWGLGLVADCAIAYLLYKMDFQIAAVLVFLGAILALFYYYVKWFQLPSKNSFLSTTSCPDFLTLIDPGSSSGLAKCMDYVGVSANGRLQQSDPNNVDQQSDPNFVFTIDRSQPTTDLCQSAASYGLTWASLCPA